MRAFLFVSHKPFHHLQRKNQLKVTREIPKFEG
jgi:hypothetical protein